MTAEDVAINIALASLILPILIVFLWAQHINNRKYPSSLEGFGGLLLVFIFYLAIVRIPASTIRLFSYLAQYSAELRTFLWPLLVVDAIISIAILVLSITSVILAFKFSRRFPSFYWRSVWIGFILIFIDFCVASAYALSQGGLELLLISAKLFFLNKGMIFGNILLPLISGLYILKSKRVNNTFLPTVTTQQAGKA